MIIMYKKKKNNNAFIYLGVAVLLFIAITVSLLYQENRSDECQ